MKGSVKSVEELHYARVKRVEVDLGDGFLAVEVPEKVLEEVGWNPSPGDSVEVELSRERPESLEGWDIVMGGYVYLKKEEENVIYASLGGLKMTASGEKFYGAFNVDDKVYLMVKLPGKT